MAKKNIDISSIIQQAKTDIEAANDFDYGPKYIPDIITFCNSPEYLDLEQRGIILRPFQRIMLKIFYRGSKGNENLRLTDGEIDLCKKNKLDNDDNGNVLAKYATKETFRELVLVWGRRAGKDFLASLIATYEAMRLLECEGGDPYAIYHLAPSNPISILTIATAGKQAELAFQEIKDKILNSKYFRSKVGPEGVETYKICLLTDKDRSDNKDRIERGLPLIKGSILVEVGHSNPDSLVGKQVFVMILDEVASYKRTGGSSSGDKMYRAMNPSLMTFVRNIKTYDEYGIEKIDIVYDSKIVSISSPQEAAGKFYELFRKAPMTPKCLACRLPSWIVNENLTEISLREENQFMSEEEFLMEYGAQFSGTGGETFFPRVSVDACFSGIKAVDMGKPGVVYFAHLDPATSSHNYALVIVHRDIFYNPEIRQNDFNIIVDHIKYWHPLPDKPINSVMVDEYILSLRRRFFFALVTYDVWNSKESIKKLRKVGIPSKSVHYTKKYKMAIYDELYNLIISGKLKIPPHALTRNELLNLQRKFTAPSGYSVFPKKEGDVTTDDLCVIPETYVKTKDGLKYIKDIQIGDYTFSNNSEYEKVLDKICHITNKEIYELKSNYSFSLKCTENHPIEIYDPKKGERQFKKCSEIIKGEYIIKPIGREIKEKTIDLFNFVDIDCGAKSNITGENRDDFSRIIKIEDDIEYIRSNNGNSRWHKRYIKYDYNFGYFCGVYLSEGSCSDHGISFATNSNEVDFRNRIRECITFVFGKKKYFENNIEESHSSAVMLNSVVIKKLIKHLFNSKIAITKEIPNDMMIAPKDFQIGLLKGFFDGNGTKAIKTLKKGIVFTTGSEKLAYQIQDILLRFDIISSISISRRKGKSVYFKDREVKYNSDLFNVKVMDISSYNKLSELFMLNNRKNKSKFHKEKYIFCDNFVACKVRNIQKISCEKEVYNLLIENTNSYVCNGISTHNCDALAGACYNAISYSSDKLPYSSVVQVSNTPSINNRMWQSMSGPLGYGTGKQVSDRLEKINSWPNYKRVGISEAMKNKRR